MPFVNWRVAAQWNSIQNKKFLNKTLALQPQSRGRRPTAPPPRGPCTFIRLQRHSPVLEHVPLNGKHLRAGTLLHSAARAQPQPQPQRGQQLHHHIWDPGEGWDASFLRLTSSPVTQPCLLLPPACPFALPLLCFPNSSPSVFLAGRAFRTSPVALREMVTSRVRWLSRAWGGRCRQIGVLRTASPHTSSHPQSRSQPLPQSLACVIHVQ